MSTSGIYQSVRSFLSRMREDRYIKELVSVYAHPLSKPREEFDLLRRQERELAIDKARSRFERDRMAIIQTILRQMGFRQSDDASKTMSVVSDVVQTITSRYVDCEGRHSDSVRCMLQALSAVSAGDPLLDWSKLPDHLHAAASGPIQGETPSKQCSTAPHAVWSLFEADRLTMIRMILNQVIEEGLIPRFYDYDYLDDIAPIIESRYASPDGMHPERSRPLLQALSVLSAGDPSLDRTKLPEYLREVLGEKDGFVPRRGVVNPYVQEVIPDLVEEFVNMRAEDDVQRFLEINRQYSGRQRRKQGKWDNRDLSLLREYESDHHLLLRTIIALIRDGKIQLDDEVLLVGPRHIDEIHFFRKHLGLSRTIGLDLFDSDGGLIVGGDMHAMPFMARRFRVIYCAGTLSYSYNVRKVVKEMTRVLARPGYIFLIDAADRIMGPDPLGRSDVVGVEAMIQLFYACTFTVLAQDRGRSLAPHLYRWTPCLALELNARSS